MTAAVQDLVARKQYILACNLVSARGFRFVSQQKAFDPVNGRRIVQQDTDLVFASPSLLCTIHQLWFCTLMAPASSFKFSSSAFDLPGLAACLAVQEQRSLGEHFG